MSMKKRLFILLLPVLLGRNDIVEALLGNLPNHWTRSLRAARCSNRHSPPLVLFFGSSSTDNNQEEESTQKKNSIGVSGLLQLITAG